MTTAAIHHAYNDVVASHYDRDPQGVIGRSLAYAMEQLSDQGFLGGSAVEPRQVLDLGMGTGLFLGKLKALGGSEIVPYGLDLAQNMVENARGESPT